MNNWLDDLRATAPQAAASYVETEDHFNRLQAEAHRATALAATARRRLQAEKARLDPIVNSYRQHARAPARSSVELLKAIVDTFGSSSIGWGSTAKATDPVLATFGTEIEVDAGHKAVRAIVWRWTPARGGNWAPGTHHMLRLTGAFKGQRKVSIAPERLQVLLLEHGVKDNTPEPKPKNDGKRLDPCSPEALERIQERMAPFVAACAEAGTIPSREELNRVVLEALRS